MSVEDAVHQRMTAHLEASAVAGISSSGPEREPLQPTILTSPYGTMGKLILQLTIMNHPSPFFDVKDAAVAMGILSNTLRSQQIHFLFLIQQSVPTCS